MGLSRSPSLAQTRPKIPVVDEPPLNLPDLPDPAVPPEQRELTDPQEFEGFIDSILDRELAKSSTPGAVVSVVKDGEIFFAKGYGYANVERKTPVVADRTLFRVASLSKLFTVTAAMQLYEQGKIGLSEDIRPYLDFDLENPYSEPITPAQIMTHTDGTSKRRIGLAARTEAELQSLREHLPDHMPPVVWQPGKLYSYSSYSTALLGYLIERIAKTSFFEYINENILQPLDMQRSTFRQPPPPELVNDLATGYQKQNQKFSPIPYLYLNIYPAASLQTTAIDMAHFMIAHLQLGRYENQQILQPVTAALMHNTQFTQHPELPGTSYGFREQFINNIRTIGHLGSLLGYSSSLTLLPDRNIGIFIASNSFSGIHGQLLAQIFNRYFPAPETPPPAPAVDINPSRYTGYYRDLEYPRHTLTKLTGLFKHIQITGNQDNTLTLKTPNLFFLNKLESKQLVPLNSQLFQRVKDNAFTAFGEGEDGQIRFAFNPLYPKIGTYERVPWYEAIWMQLGWLGFCVVFFLSACILWVIRPLIQLLRHKPLAAANRLNWALRTAGLVGTLNLVFLIGLPLYLWSMGVWKLVYGVPPIMIAFLCLPIITTILALALPIAATIAWKKKHWSVGQRWHYTLVTFAALAFIPLLLYWNLLGFQF